MSLPRPVPPSPVTILRADREFLALTTAVDHRRRGARAIPRSGLFAGVPGCNQRTRFALRKPCCHRCFYVGEGRIASSHVASVAVVRFGDRTGANLASVHFRSSSGRPQLLRGVCAAVLARCNACYFADGRFALSGRAGHSWATPYSLPTAASCGISITFPPARRH